MRGVIAIALCAAMALGLAGCKTLTKRTPKAMLDVNLVTPSPS